MRKRYTRATVSSRIPALAKAVAPGGAPESIDPYFRGPNVLTDPGFENTVANSGGWYWKDRPGGSDMHSLPYLDLSCPTWLRYPDGTCAEKSFISWAHCTGPYIVDDLRLDACWKVSTWNPDSGYWHALWVSWNQGGTGRGGNLPGEICVLNPWLSGPFSARVNPGDSVTWSVRATTAPYLGSQALAHVRFYSGSYTNLAIVSGTPVTLTASYQTVSMSTVAPPGTVYVRGEVGFYGGTTNPFPLCVDSAVLGVS